jgi:AcrR family transcriptional regulator
MVDVARAAGVSRQTLYNEFGSKDGLARALVLRETDLYLRGVERLLAVDTGTEARLVSVAEWTVGEAGARPLLRALLTGCWGERLPTPRAVRDSAGPSGIPGYGPAGAAPPAPDDLLAWVRDRSVAALGGSGATEEDQDRERADGAAAGRLYRCELAVRLALAHVIAPGGEPVGRLVRAAVGAIPAEESVGEPVSGPSRRAADRLPR